jgi:S1-C subfamily serine protease
MGRRSIVALALALASPSMASVAIAQPAPPSTSLDQLEARLRDRFGKQPAATTNAAQEETTGAEEAKEAVGPAESTATSPPPGLGITIEEQVTGSGQARLVVATIEPQSLAQRAGIQVGDVVEQVGTRRVMGVDEAGSAIDELARRGRIPMVVIRERKRIPLVIRIADQQSENATADANAKSEDILPPPPGSETASDALSVPSLEKPERGNSDRSSPNRSNPNRSNLVGGGRLGVVVEDVPVGNNQAVRRGAIIVRINPGSPAESIPMEVGDIIVGVNGKRIASARMLTDLMRQSQPGERVELTYFRGSAMVRSPIVLADPAATASTNANAPTNDRSKPDEANRSATDVASKSQGLTGWLGGLLGGQAATGAANAASTKPSPPVATPPIATPRLSVEDLPPIQADPSSAAPESTALRVATDPPQAIAGQPSTGEAITGQAITGQASSSQPNGGPTNANSTNANPTNANPSSGEPSSDAQVKLTPPTPRAVPSDSGPLVPPAVDGGPGGSVALPVSAPETNQRTLELLQRLEARLEAIEARLTNLESRLPTNP